MIPYEAGLSSLREALDKRTCKEIPTENLIKMAEFVLKNNFLSLIPMYINRFQVLLLDQLETKFLENQNLKPLVWFHYIDDIFFI